MDEDRNDLEDASAGLSGVTSPFPIVGVGASAGGLEAFVEMLSNLPASPGMAFVFVSHLDPEHQSLLPEILSRHSPIPVSQAVDNVAIEKDHVYVIPPNCNLAIAGGRLSLSPRQEPPGLFMPIDHFLRSLARQAGVRPIAVILSGSGTDGTLALGDIKSTDGIVIAQEERSAKYDAMPRSAVDSGFVDFVLTPENIGRELVRLGKRFPIERPGHPADKPDEKSAQQRILQLARQISGVDFSQYKQSTMLRRICRRMVLCGIETYTEYAQRLEEQPEELHALVQDLLIRVTSFFRDTETFQAVKDIVFSRLLRDREEQQPIRLWVVGCSTGEEVYSLAMVLVEMLGDMANITPVKILATDVSELALERARAGLYADNIAMDISPERLRRFFVNVNGKYQISKSIRDLCVFSKHNVTADPPFANIDLISCRNLFIYFSAGLQRRVLAHFHYALRPNGCLMLGTSETIGNWGHLFQVLDQDARIFAKKPGSLRASLDLVQRESSHVSAGAPTRNAPVHQLLEMQREAELSLLARFAPPGLIIDTNLTILHFRGNLAPYMSPTSGHATLDATRMLRDSLAMALRTAVQEAQSEKHLVRREGISISDDGSIRTVAIEVTSLGSQADTPQAFLVLFDAPQGQVAPHRDKAPAPLNPVDEENRIQQLECELTAVREYVQSLVEDHEAANEELKSAQEELLSSNEELQSTNEELQTSKEEMQSAHEELATVNDELQHRNKELRKLNDDLNNLLGGLNIPIIMVDRELAIRRFTAPAESLFNVLTTDMGRPISHLRPNFQVSDLSKLIMEVITNVSTIEIEVQNDVGRWYSLRIRPYITTDNRIDGASLAVVDIDSIKRAAEQLRASRDSAEAIVETVWEPLIVLDQQLRVNRANAAFYRIFEIGREEVQERSIWEIGAGRWNQPELRSALERVLPDNYRIRDLEIEILQPSGHRLSLLVNAHRIFWEGSRTQMVLVAMEDITNRKRELEHAKLLAMEQAARAEAETASRQKDEFLAMLAHEMRNPLAPIRNTFYILRQRFGDDTIAREALEMSDRQISHLTRMLDDLLDVSRTTRGKIELKREFMNVQQSVEAALRTSRHNIAERQHHLTVSLPPEPIHVSADPARFEQILCNLLNNAAKYTEPGGSITVAVEKETDAVVIRVRDTGVGISHEMLPHIFELFTQDDHTLARSQGGLGIGLTLARQLTELHGGTIEAHSAGPGQGTELVIRLPAIQDATSTDQQAEAAELPSITQPRRILVVDDNVDSARTLGTMLRLRGHQVEMVHDGRAALATIASTRPDLVLLDIGLPDFDGYEVARRIRTELQMQDLPLVALTGYGQENDRQHSVAVGINAHLVKPVEMRVLERTIEDMSPPRHGTITDS